MEFEEKIAALKQLGFQSVYQWSAEPGEEDLKHTHPFDTRILVLEGEIEIEMDDKMQIIKSGEEVDIPRGKLHSGKVGIGGCKYLVAEKH